MQFCKLVLSLSISSKSASKVLSVTIWRSNFAIWSCRSFFVMSNPVCAAEREAEKWSNHEESDGTNFKSAWNFIVLPAVFTSTLKLFCRFAKSLCTRAIKEKDLRIASGKSVVHYNENDMKNFGRKKKILTKRRWQPSSPIVRWYVYSSPSLLRVQLQVPPFQTRFHS